MNKKLVKSMGLFLVLSTLIIGLNGCTSDNKEPTDEKTETTKDSNKTESPAIISENFLPTDTDFKTQIAKLKSEGVDAIFINPQTPPKADLLMKQLEEQGTEGIQIFGNDVVVGYKEGLNRYPKLVEGMIGAEASYNENHADLKYFVEEYKKQTGDAEVPYMSYAATSFDAVRLIAQGVAEVGYDADKFKGWLYDVEGWQGAAGNLTIDKNGDPGAGHKAKIVKNGVVILYGEEASSAPTTGSSESSAGIPTPADKTKEPIKIGGILPLTGDGAAYGVPMQKIAEIAVAKVNMEGGINGAELKITWEDGKCNGKDAASAAQKLINVDKVKIIYGGFCSSETIGIAPIAEAAKVIVLSPGSSSPDITTIGDYIFRNYPSDSAQGAILADIAKGKGLKKIGMLTEENDYTIGIEKAFKAAFAK